MTSFCICCELRRGAKHHYDDFFAAFERFEDRCHALEGVWFICTDWSAKEVSNYLRRYLDSEDNLSVEELAESQGLSGWVRQDVQEWLRRHVGPSRFG